MHQIHQYNYNTVMLYVYNNVICTTLISFFSSFSLLITIRGMLMQMKVNHVIPINVPYIECHF